MARLVFRAAARRDIAEIATFLLKRSKDRHVADAFVDKVISFCEALARRPALAGRARPEFGRRGYRSAVFGAYVIFIRYGDEEGLLDPLYVVHIVHSARDLDAYFERSADPD